MLTFVTDLVAGTSEFVVLDAKTLADEASELAFQILPITAILTFAIACCMFRCSCCCADAAARSGGLSRHLRARIGPAGAALVTSLMDPLPNPIGCYAFVHVCESNCFCVVARRANSIESEQVVENCGPFIAENRKEQIPHFCLRTKAKPETQGNNTKLKASSSSSIRLGRLVAIGRRRLRSCSCPCGRTTGRI